MKIPDKADFQPSAETMMQWLATRKPTLMVGGASFPAFFDDTGNSSDTSWVWLAAFGEIVGLITTIYGGFKNGGIFLFLSGLAIVMFIILDVVFAKWLHRNKAAQCMGESRKLIVSDRSYEGSDRASELAGIQYDLNKGKGVDFFLITGIILIALFKIVGIIVLGVFNNLVLYAPFAILYLIVAYIHIYHTGYYIAYRSTEKRIWKDHRQFSNKNGFTANDPVERFETKGQLDDVPIKHTPHEIVKDESRAEGFHYMIKTKGVLTDDDIVNLVSGQDSDNRIAVFKACRKLQVESIRASG